MLTVAEFQGETSSLVIDWPPAKPASKREGGLGAEGISLLLEFVHICLRSSRLQVGFQNKEFLQESINGSFVTGEVEYLCFRINPICERLVLNCLCSLHALSELSVISENSNGAPTICQTACLPLGYKSN